MRKMGVFRAQAGRGVVLISSILLTFCATYAGSDSPPRVGETREEAEIPICSADTEGAVSGGSLTGSAKPQFIGRVVRVGADGKRIPMPSVRIFRYTHHFWIPDAVSTADWDPQRSYLAPQDFKTDADGAFHDTSSNTGSDPHFSIRSPGFQNGRGRSISRHELEHGVRPSLLHP
jgi:hypothetical protein